jgi:chromosome segregation ATPase
LVKLNTHEKRSEALSAELDKVYAQLFEQKKRNRALDAEADGIQTKLRAEKKRYEELQRTNVELREEVKEGGLERE